MKLDSSSYSSTVETLSIQTNALTLLSARQECAGGGERYLEVDALRGVAIVLMITFHVIFDLRNFGVPSISTAIDLPRVFWEWFPNLSSTLFLILVGVSAVLATKLTSQPRRKLARQSLKILACAALVTLGSLIMTPQAVIHFGVLHCIGVSLLMIYPFLRSTQLSLILGMGILAAGELLTSIPISTPWFLALGLKPTHFRTGDYFPVIPFFGLVLLGVALGRVLYVNGCFRLSRFPALMDVIQSKLGRGLQKLGRHSLLIYLVHQPAIFLFIYALGLLRTHG